MRSFGFAVSMFAIVWAAIAYACGLAALTPYTKRARSGAAALAVVFAAAVALALVRAPRIAAAPAVLEAPRVRASSCDRIEPSEHVARGVLDVVRTAAQSQALPDGASVTRADTVILDGWVADENVRGPVVAACLIVDGKRFALQRGRYGDARPDVARAFAHTGAANTGFEIRFDAHALAPGTHALVVVGVDANGRGQPLGAPHRITVR